ncbi:receptor-like kinase TMK2 isoform X2 [Malus sylvestris]|uniref:receptor-like kinase TMK2 isoform X2 n=1 Tax=Malus sylvestris TaxID=3752 RepID=UPI0021AD4ECB|nr:receptor-like kinase TMK2 isoform X2 [Malus sylvestris]
MPSPAFQHNTTGQDAEYTLNRREKKKRLHCVKTFSKVVRSWASKKFMTGCPPRPVNRPTCKAESLPHDLDLLIIGGSSGDHQHKASITGNSLSGALPSLANLSSLQEVYLDTNNFISIPAGCFMGLSSLQILSMSQNINLDSWVFPLELTEASSLVTFAAVLKGSFTVFPNAGQEKNVMSPKNSEYNQVQIDDGNNLFAL